MLLHQIHYAEAYSIMVMGASSAPRTFSDKASTGSEMTACTGLKRAVNAVKTAKPVTSPNRARGRRKAEIFGAGNMSKSSSEKRMQLTIRATLRGGKSRKTGL